MRLVNGITREMHRHQTLISCQTHPIDQELGEYTQMTCDPRQLLPMSTPDALPHHCHTHHILTPFETVPISLFLFSFIFT